MWLSSHGELLFINMGKVFLVWRKTSARVWRRSIDCWAAYRTRTLNFGFLIAFPPLKVTTFKLFLDLKSRLGGIMVFKACPKPRWKGFPGSFAPTTPKTQLQSHFPQTTQFIQNSAVFCEEISGKNNALHTRLTYKRTHLSW